MRTARLEWWPIADNAVTWMRTWDVGTRHTPLVGPHSRLEFNHPGPLMYYMLAIPLRLFWGVPSALLVGALVISVASAAAVVLFTARYADSSAGLVVAIATLVLSAAQGYRLCEPWNPFLIVLPFALFIVTTWFASAGHFAAAPVAAVAGTLAAQSHLGALPPVALIGATGLLLRIVSPPAGAPRLPSRKRTALLVGLLALLWAPPALEQFVPGHRNVSSIVGYFMKTESDVRVGWSRGLAVTGSELLPWGPWIGLESKGLLHDALPGPIWFLFASLVPPGVAALLAARFRDGFVARLVALEATGFVATFLAISQIRGVPFYYLTLWSRPIAMFGAISPFIVLARRFGPRGARWDEWRVVLNALGVAAVVIRIAVSGLRAPVPTAYWSRVHGEVIAHAMNVVQPHETWRIVVVGPYYTGSPETIAVAFERSGRSGKLMPWYAPAVGEERTIPWDAKVPTLVLATGVGIERVPQREKATMLYLHDPYAGRPREMIIELRRKLAGDLVTAGRSDLVPSLEASLPYLWLKVPPAIDQASLGSFLRLTAGDDNTPVALFAIPPTTW